MPRFMYRTRRRRAAKRFVKLQRRFKKRRKPLRTQVRRLRKQVNKDIEHRWQDDITYSFTVPAAGGTVEPIGLELISTTPTAGLNDDRLGNKITLKSIYLKGQLICSDSHNFVRILLVKVVSLNQIVVASDILQPDATTGNPTLYSPYRKESRIKYQILKDKFYKLANSTAAVPSPGYPFLVNVDLSYKWPKGLTITYNQAAASVPIYTNVQVIAISDSVIVTHPTFRGAKRLTWIA